MSRVEILAQVSDSLEVCLTSLKICRLDGMAFSDNNMVGGRANADLCYRTFCYWQVRQYLFPVQVGIFHVAERS